MSLKNEVRDRCIFNFHRDLGTNTGYSGIAFGEHWKYITRTNEYCSYPVAAPKNQYLLSTNLGIIDFHWIWY